VTPVDFGDNILYFSFLLIVFLSYVCMFEGEENRVFERDLSDIIMVFYQPGVTPHNLPRNPFKVPVHCPILHA
jgi:hypothetical protein